MSPRKFLIAGVAGLALTVAAAAPALAQYRNQSTPRERAQTEQLNRGAVDGQSYVPAERQAQYDSARSDYETAQQRYQEQLNDYNAKNRAYQDQRDRYRAQRDTYQDQRENYADQQDTYEDRDDAYRGYPPLPVARSLDTARLWTLDRFNDPDYELYNVPVVDVDGFTVGHFRRVETRDNGERMAILTLNSQRTVALPAEEVFYDPDMALVVANLTSYEIDRTPSGPLGP
jgi:hypothetical protein